MDQATAFTGSATSFTEGDLSSVITVSTTDAVLLWNNIGDTPLVLSWRKTGRTDNNNVPLEPGMFHITHVAVTSARTVEYKIDNGTIECDVLYFFGA